METFCSGLVCGWLDAGGYGVFCMLYRRPRHTPLPGKSAHTNTFIHTQSYIAIPVSRHLEAATKSSTRTRAEHRCLGTVRYLGQNGIQWIESDMVGPEEGPEGRRPRAGVGAAGGTRRERG